MLGCAALRCAALCCAVLCCAEAILWELSSIVQVVDVMVCILAVRQKTSMFDVLLQSLTGLHVHGNQMTGNLPSTWDTTNCFASLFVVMPLLHLKA